jgi:hypothetical protein
MWWREPGQASPELSLRHSPCGGGSVGFSGIRAIIMVAVLIVLLLGVIRFDLPGWLLPVGLIAAGVVVKAWEKRASS